MSVTEDVLSKLPNGWVIWQVFDGSVCLQITDGDLKETLHEATFDEVIEKANGYRVLPRLRRRPDIFDAASYEPQKFDGRWYAFHRDRGRIECAFKTRRECGEFIDRMLRKSVEDVAEWDAKFNEMFPNGASEGIDFRWDN